MSPNNFHPQSLVESHSIGQGTCIWAFAHVLPGAVIGDDCNVGDHSFIEGKAVLGSRVTIKNGVSVWDYVTLEDDCFVGPNAVFTNDLFPISRKGGDCLEKTYVKRGTCIGANAVIVCGHTIGRYVMIGAGSVVTQDIPDFALVYGNPARIHGFLCECRQKLAFTQNKAVCTCGLKYQKNKNDLVEQIAAD